MCESAACYSSLGQRQQAQRLSQLSVDTTAASSLQFQNVCWPFFVVSCPQPCCSAGDELPRALPIHFQLQQGVLAFCLQC